MGAVLECEVHDELLYRMGPCAVGRRVKANMGSVGIGLRRFTCQDALTPVRLP